MWSIEETYPFDYFSFLVGYCKVLSHLFVADCVKIMFEKKNWITAAVIGVQEIWNSYCLNYH